MQKKGCLVSLFYFNDNIAGKDMFLVPKYLADQLGMQAEIVFPKQRENEHLRGEYRGVKLTAIKSKSRYHSTFWTEKEMLWWLIRNARRIDVLSLFWLNTRNALFAKVYKFINPRGICYIKGDVNEASILQMPDIQVGTLKSKVKKWLYNRVDILSVETSASYDHIRNGCMGRYLSKIVNLVPNAFDDKFAAEVNANVNTYEQKDNIIITVGRIGHPDKNNELVLDALNGLDMKGWKFIFVGPYESDFKVKIDSFLTNNPDKKESVILFGKVTDKLKLWNIYASSKVFVLTSPKEGFPNVFPEALIYGHYIITTAVSSTKDIVPNDTIGKVIPVGDAKGLSIALKQIFESEIDLESNFGKILEHSQNFTWTKVIKPIADQIYAKVT